MKKILIAIIILVSVPLTLAVQDPGLVFCQLQGYDAKYSVKIQYGNNNILFVPGNPQKDKILFPVTFRKEDKSNSGYFEVKDIYGLSEDEKQDLIEKIRGETDFGRYRVERVNTTDGYDQGWSYSIMGEFENFISCDFPNGDNCSWDNFKDKKCGGNYLKEIPCVSEGESIHQMFEDCCDGLEVYNLRPDCEGCLPICRSPPTNILVRFWNWLKGIF